MTADPEVRRLADLLRASEHAVALTGAGVSTESGIPDFRSPGEGVWHRVDPFEVASLSGLRRNPEAFFRFWRWRFGMLAAAEPNVTHRLLAALERQGLVKAIVTQNIDGLHRRAGSQCLYEVHGRYDRAHCLECGAEYRGDRARDKLLGHGIARCDGCMGLVKPAVVLFEESMPEAFWQSEAEVRRCDLLLVLGSSLEVYPVAGLVPLGRSLGSRLAIVNRDPTPFDDRAHVVIRGELGDAMAALARELGVQGVLSARPPGPTARLPDRHR